MALLKGITVNLMVRVKVGEDGFKQPIYTYKPVPVSNVLVRPSDSQEVTDSINLYGKKAVYTLAIPKGDTNNWENQRIEFFGKTWQSFGFSTEGIEHLMPLDWNKKVMVAIYG